MTEAQQRQIIGGLTNRSGLLHFRVQFEGKTGPGGPPEIDPQATVVTIPGDPMVGPRVSSGWTPLAGVRSLIPQAKTTSSGVWYMRETSFTNRAGPVFAGGLKPQSDATYEAHVSPVTTVAHFAKLSKQLADDYPAFMAQLQTRLLYFLALMEDDQILNGTGVSGQTDGILPAAVTVLGVTQPVAPENLTDAVYQGAAEVAAAGYIPTGVVLNSSDWWKVPRIPGVSASVQTQAVAPPQFDSTAQYDSAAYPEGAYNLVQSIWGIPVIPSIKMPVGQFLVGDFIRGAQIFDREQGGIQIAEENQDDFVRDILTIRAESRFANCVYQPGAFRKAA